MPDSQPNGDHVTWRELNLALKPLIDGQFAMDKKLDAVLLAQAKSEGAREASHLVRDTFLESKWRVIGVSVAVLGSSSFAFAVALLLRKGH